MQHAAKLQVFFG